MKPSSLLAGMALLLSPSTLFAHGTFSVLTYNVRGLPPQVIEDRAAEIAAIAPLLEDFHTSGGDYAGIDSIVLLQELFDQPYYDTITDAQTVSFPFITPKSTAGQFGLGDGVNALSDFSFAGHTRVPWTDCFGTSGDNGSDCDTPKGFSFARFDVGEGATVATVDVYNLHADASQDEGSRAARRANITQLIASINTNSPPGTAVIVTGDTNSHYTRSPNDNIETLLSGAGVTDVWVELVNGGAVPGPGPDNESGCDANPSGAACELIDKIFYRSGDDVILTPIEYDVVRDLFNDATLGDLSDHFPVSARFDWADPTGSTTTTTTGPTTTSVPVSTSTTPTSTSTTVTTSTTLPAGGACGDPVLVVAHALGSGPGDALITASDALFILRAAIGSQTCALCLCDVDGGGTVTAADALRALKKAVGQTVTLSCPVC